MLNNPMYIYNITFLLVFILYPLDWSNLYKSLDISVIVFFLFTFVISFFIGRFIECNKKLEFIKIKDSDNIKKKIVFLMLLTIIQIFLDPKVPLLNVIKNSNSNHGTYGLSILHPFILTYASFLGVYVFHLFISERKKKFLLYFFILSIPSIIFYSRGTLAITLITCIFVIISFNSQNIKKWNTKKIIFIVMLLILVMFLFGYLGNARTGGSSSGILYSGDATEKFINNPIPKEFFWSYIYLTSPLANFNYNVYTQNFINNIGLNEINFFLLKNFIPDVLANRLISALNLEYLGQGIFRVHNDLTVSTIYMNSYYIFGWLGPILIYIYMSIFILFYIKMLKKNNKYYVTGFCFLNTMIGLNFFTNMLGQTSIFAPLVYSIIFGTLPKIKFRRR